MRQLAPGFDPYASDTSGFFGSIAKAVKGAAKKISGTAKQVGKGAAKGLSSVKNAVGKVPVVGAGLKAVVSVATSPLELTANIAAGHNIGGAIVHHFKGQLSAAKAIAPYVQTIVSFVPGIGTGVSGALAGAVALADGRPITEALVAATKGALPGGPLAAAAFDATSAAIQGKNIPNAVLNSLPKAQREVLKQSIDATKAIAQGKKIDKVVLDRINANLDKLPKEIRTAAQVGLAIGQGKNLQKTLVKAGSGLVKGFIPGGAVASGAFNIVSAAAQGKSVSEAALEALPIPAAQKDIIRQSVAVAKDIASGKRVDKILLDRVSANLNKLPPDLRKAAQAGLAQGKNIMNPLVQAKRILTTIEGSSKPGIIKAIGAAQSVANGSPVLKAALNVAGSQFRPGSVERLGFNTAVNILKQTQGNKNALAVARRNLPTESARRAFDTAIGAVSQTVRNSPGLQKRAGSIFNPNMSRSKGALSPYQPNLKHAISTLAKNPTLATQHPLVLANKFGTSQQTVLEALRHVGTKRLLPWRSLSPRAANYVRQYSRFSPMNALTHGTGDTAGLDETGTKYIVVKGDSPFSIAKQLTGNGNRWKELLPLNKDKKPTIDKNVWVGEVLNIPPSWQKPVVTTAAPPVAVANQPISQAPSGPVTTAAPQISIVPGVLQAKSILVAWSKTDGINESGVSDYGSNAADLSTDFGSRDKLALQSFQNWSNKPGNDAVDLVVDGILGPKSLSALQSWAESRASKALPPTSPVVTTLPEIVIEGNRPSTPVVVAPPAVVTTPAVIAPPPVIAVQTPSNPTPAVPAVSPPSQPATPATVAAATPAGSKMGPALAGAAIGGTLFGIPGAIIGGIAGAAMS